MRTPLVVLTLTSFLLSFGIGPIPFTQAQEFRLPAPGVMVHLSPTYEAPLLKGIKVHTDNPFRFDFILDKGDSDLTNDQLKQESSKLIKYFLASLTIPEKDLWVNLSPYEKDRIIPQSFGLTEMGRDLLAEDYMLKQITASLIYPEDPVGKKFWKRVYEEAVKRYGTTNIPVNTFNKVWIVPNKAIVYENVDLATAYVVESNLKVMLEQDYLSLAKHEGIQSKLAKAQETNQLGSQIVREIVIPELTKEVNENKNFSRLRQVYNSLILASWYKKKIKDSILSQVYENKNKIAGVGYRNSLTPVGKINHGGDVENIYQRYLKAFKKGVYNYIKEDYDPLTQETIPRKYFSGGASFTDKQFLDASKYYDRPTPAMLSFFKKAAGYLVVAATIGLAIAAFRTPLSAQNASDKPANNTVIHTASAKSTFINTTPLLSTVLTAYEGKKILTADEVRKLLEVEKTNSDALKGPVPEADQLMLKLVGNPQVFTNNPDILGTTIDRLAYYSIHSDGFKKMLADNILSALPTKIEGSLLEFTTNQISKAFKLVRDNDLENSIKGTKLMIPKADLDAFINGQTLSQQQLWSPDEQSGFSWISELLRDPAHQDIVDGLKALTDPDIPVTKILDALQNKGLITWQPSGYYYIARQGVVSDFKNYKGPIWVVGPFNYDREAHLKGLEYVWHTIRNKTIEEALAIHDLSLHELMEGIKYNKDQIYKNMTVDFLFIALGIMCYWAYNYNDFIKKAKESKDFPSFQKWYENEITVRSSAHGAATITENTPPNPEGSGILVVHEPVPLGIEVHKSPEKEASKPAENEIKEAPAKGEENTTPKLEESPQPTVEEKAWPKPEVKIPPMIAEATESKPEEKEPLKAEDKEPGQFESFPDFLNWYQTKFSGSAFKSALPATFKLTMNNVINELIRTGKIRSNNVSFKLNASAYQRAVKYQDDYKKEIDAYLTETKGTIDNIDLNQLQKHITNPSLLMNLQRGTKLNARYVKLSLSYAIKNMNTNKAMNHKVLVNSKSRLTVANENKFLKGGIDLTPGNMHLKSQSSNGSIRFHLDPAMIQQLQNAPGFTPVVINIRPLNSLQKFLGINANQDLTVNN